MKHRISRCCPTRGGYEHEEVDNRRLDALCGDGGIFGDPSLKFESWLTIWRSRLTRRILESVAFSPPPPKRPIIQAIKTPAALREADVHAVINERVRRYSKLSWK